MFSYFTAQSWLLRTWLDVFTCFSVMVWSFMIERNEVGKWVVRWNMGLDRVFLDTTALAFGKEFWKVSKSLKSIWNLPQGMVSPHVLVRWVVQWCCIRDASRFVYHCMLTQCLFLLFSYSYWSEMGLLSWWCFGKLFRIGAGYLQFAFGYFWNY